MTNEEKIKKLAEAISKLGNIIRHGDPEKEQLGQIDVLVREVLKE